MVQLHCQFASYAQIGDRGAWQCWWKQISKNQGVLWVKKNLESFQYSSWAMAEWTCWILSRFDYANHQKRHSRVSAGWKILVQGGNHRHRRQQRNIQGAGWYHTAPPHVWLEERCFWIPSVRILSLGLQWLYIDPKPCAKGRHTPRAEEAVYFWFAMSTGAWSFYVPERKKIEITNQVKFSENEFPFWNRKMNQRHLIGNSTEMLS